MKTEKLNEKAMDIAEVATELLTLWGMEEQRARRPPNILTKKQLYEVMNWVANQSPSQQGLGKGDKTLYELKSDIDWGSSEILLSRLLEKWAQAAGGPRKGHQNSIEEWEFGAVRLGELWSLMNKGDEVQKVSITKLSDPNGPEFELFRTLWATYALVRAGGYLWVHANKDYEKYEPETIYMHSNTMRAGKKAWAELGGDWSGYESMSLGRRAALWEDLRELITFGLDSGGLGMRSGDLADTMKRSELSKLIIGLHGQMPIFGPHMGTVGLRLLKYVKEGIRHQSVKEAELYEALVYESVIPMPDALTYMERQIKDMSLMGSKDNALLDTMHTWLTHWCKKDVEAVKFYVADKEQTDADLNYDMSHALGLGPKVGVGSQSPLVAMAKSCIQKEEFTQIVERAARSIEEQNDPSVSVGLQETDRVKVRSRI